MKSRLQQSLSENKSLQEQLDNASKYKHTELHNEELGNTGMSFYDKRFVVLT